MYEGLYERKLNDKFVAKCLTILQYNHKIDSNNQLEDVTSSSCVVAVGGNKC